MANYNKSFNFRNGVQVDEDDLIVRSSLVGIGTTIPRADLDVYGTVRSTGIITANDLYVTGVATFTNIRIGAGITIDGNAGIITASFAGDGSGLYNIPTSQWVDVDPAIYPGVGVGYSSIWAGGTVGIGTTIPRSWLQVGGDPGLSQNGVGISSIGDINASGIVTGGSFVGSGADITNINASNIASGTLDTARLSSNISVSGVVTAQTFSGQVNSGVATITTLSGTTGTVTNLTSTNLSGTIGTVTTLESTTGTVTNLTSTNLSGTIGTVTTLESTSGTITNLSGTIGTVTTLSGTDLNYTGFGTVGFLTSTSANVTNLTGTIATVTNISGTDLNYTGFGTIGVLTATNANIGILTLTNSTSGDIQLGVTASNQIDTSTGNLVLDSNGGTVDINDAIDVSGTSTLQGEVTVNTGIVPDTSTGAYLGQSGEEFSELWVDNIKIGVGVGNSNRIETVTEDLVLDSNSNQVVADSNFRVVGVTTLSGDLTLGGGIEPSTDLNATLGTASKRFSSSQVASIRVGVAQTNEIDTIDNTDLVLDSSSGTTRITDDLLVSGIGSFGGELTAAIGLVPDTSKGAYLGTSGKPFSEAFINDVTIGESNANEIDTTSGNLRINADSGQTEILTNITVSGVSTFSQETHFTGLSTFYTGIVPDDDKGAFIGTNGKKFQEAYLNEVRIGAGGSTRIDTLVDDLKLTANTNIVRVLNDLVVDSDTTLRSNTFFGDSEADAFVTINPSSSLVGIGTTIPNERFQVIDDANNLKAEFISRDTQSQIGIGLSEVGAGTSVGIVGYALSTLSLTNEDIGGINFTIHSGSSTGIGTTGFKWIYGQTSANLMQLDYDGKLSLGNQFNGSNTITSVPSTVAISSASGIGQTALYVSGETYLFGDTTINGNITSSDANNFSYDEATETLTVNNLTVNGTSTGIVASGVGITITDFNEESQTSTSFGSIGQIAFGRGIQVSSAGVGSITVLSENSRQSLTTSTGSIGAGTTVNVTITGYPTYALQKIGISSAAWVVLYTDEDSRTADASRSHLTTPSAGSGVIAEYHTTTSGVSTSKMSPGVIGWNDAEDNTIFARVTNNESSSADITVTLTAIRLED